MPNKLIKLISEYFKQLRSDVLLVENTDGFLCRVDVIEALKDYGISIDQGSAIHQRIQFELKDANKVLALVSGDNESYLEDIKQNAKSFSFFIKDFIQGYHIPTIIGESLSTLESLYNIHQNINLTKSQTSEVIQKIKSLNQKENDQLIDLEKFRKEVEDCFNDQEVKWKVVIEIISSAILNTIGTDQFPDVMTKVNEVNELFQARLKADFQATKNSNAVKKPQIVSKILDYLDFNFRNKKVALIVVDGLSYWQYELLREKLDGKIKDDVIYSWIPSITQLSRQAIFKGDNPILEYKQGPVNEKKLWDTYWLNRGLNSFEIRYNHGKINLKNLDKIKRFALVFKDLDDYMHTSIDYKDLLNLTENWIERSKIQSVVQTLLQNDFNVFLTTDHGNIQAKGWRGLQGQEKLGTKKSGSRSERHIEYSEKYLFDDFMLKNPELESAVLLEGNSIFFKNDLSFSGKETLVSHGGAHLLEVLIPFIEITNE